MHRGEIVESGETDEVFTNPRHDHTRRLLDAVPSNWGGRFPASVNLL
jgi:peptide/nickel transport system ATP-binding protein